MERHLEIARAVVEELKKIPGVTTSYIDDYTKHGSFQVVVEYDFRSYKYIHNKEYYPKDKANFSLRSITSKIKKILKENKEVSDWGKEICHPKRQYERSYGECEFRGYDSDWSMVHFITVPQEEQVTVSELLKKK
jgi:hypothetical protein